MNPLLISSAPAFSDGKIFITRISVGEALNLSLQLMVKYFSRKS